MALACGSAAVASASACTSEHALGDLSTRDLAVGVTPDSGGLAPGEGDGVLRIDTEVAAGLAQPDVTLAYEADALQRVVSGIGDVDGDGFGDFAALGVDRRTQATFVHLRYGGPRPASAAAEFLLSDGGARLLVDAPAPELVGPIVPAGDVDADGYSDVLVLLGRCFPTRAGEGAYLLYGGPEQLTGARRMADVGVFLESPRAPGGLDAGGSCSGGNARYAAGLGDTDGDGFDDIALVDPLAMDIASVTALNAAGDSSVYVFRGKAERLATGTSWAAADLRLSAHQDLQLAPTGDVDADGFADLIVGARTSFEAMPSQYFWLPGAAAAESGTLALEQLGVPLAGASPVSMEGANATPDVDGDGTPDLLLNDDSYSTHLFYGGPGLLAGGVDFAASAARFETDNGDGASFCALGDRDGDGDSELVANFDIAPSFTRGVAFVSGSSRRFAVAVQFPVSRALENNPTGRLAEEMRFLEAVFDAGDLDGDGASDLLSLSAIRDPSDDSGGLVPWAPALHIHYGSRARAVPDPR